MRWQTAQCRKEEGVPERDTEEAAQRQPPERKRLHRRPSDQTKSSSQQQKTQQALNESHRHRRELFTYPLKKKRTHRPGCGGAESGQNANEMRAQRGERIANSIVQTST